LPCKGFHSSSFAVVPVYVLECLFIKDKLFFEGCRDFIHKYRSTLIKERCDEAFKAGKKTDEQRHSHNNRALSDQIPIKPAFGIDL